MKEMQLDQTQYTDEQRLMFENFVLISFISTSSLLKLFLSFTQTRSILDKVFLDRFPITSE